MVLVFESPPEVYWPLPQAEQLADPADEYVVSEPHGSHDFRSETSCRPAAHLVHEPAAAPDIFPTAHLEHSVLPAPAKVPAPQLTQPLLPLVVNLPAPQVLHLVAPPVE